MESQISTSNHGYLHVPSTSSGRVLTTPNKFSENPKPYSSGLRALVVDSNPASRKFISSMLSDNKYEVVAVESAAEALTFISQRKNELDLVLTEFNLPDMDGIEFLQRIKRESKLPVVFLSSEMREEVKILCLSKGASVYLEKPILARDVKNLWQLTVFNRYNNNSKNKRKRNKTIDATAVANVNKGKSVRKNKGGSSSEMVGDNFRCPVSMRSKMIWTEELHLKFVDAVNTLGFLFARPRMILKHMNVPGLTATNVSSHLQKYRLSVKQKDRKSSSPEIATPAEIQNNNDDLIYSGKFGSSSSQFLPGSNNNRQREVPQIQKPPPPQSNDNWQREVPQIQKPPPQQQLAAATIEPTGYKVQFKSNLLSNASLVTPPNSVQLLNHGMLSAAKSASESLEARGGLTALRSHQLGSSPSPNNYVGPRICVNQRGDQRIKFGKPSKSNGDPAVQMIKMAMLSGGASNSGIGSVNNPSPVLLSNSIGGIGNIGSIKNNASSALLNNLISGDDNTDDITESIKNSTSLVLLSNSIGDDSNGNIGSDKNSTNSALLSSSIGDNGNTGSVKNSTSSALLSNLIGGNGNTGSVKNSTSLALLNNSIGGDDNTGSVKNSTSLTLLNNSIGGDGNTKSVKNSTILALLNNSIGGDGNIGSVKNSTIPILLYNSIGDDGNIRSVKNSTTPALLKNLIGGDDNIRSVKNSTNSVLLNNSFAVTGNIEGIKSSTSPAVLKNSIGGDGISDNIGNGVLNNSVQKQLGLGGSAPISPALTLATPPPAVVAPGSAPALAPVSPAVVASAPALPTPAVVSPPAPVSVPPQEQDGNKGYEEFDSELFDMRNSPIPDLFGQEEFDDLSFLWSSSS